MHYLRNGAARNAVLIGIAVAALGAAAFFSIYFSRRDAAPTDQYVGLYCPKCQKYYQISDRDFETLLDKREFKQGGGMTPGEKGMTFKCPYCGEMTAHRAAGPPTSEPPAPPPGDGG